MITKVCWKRIWTHFTNWRTALALAGDSPPWFTQKKMIANLVLHLGDHEAEPNWSKIWRKFDKWFEGCTFPDPDWPAQKRKIEALVNGVE